MLTVPNLLSTPSLLPSGMKLLNKTAEPVQVTGAHAVAFFADTKHNCHFYASSALPALATAPSAAFFVPAAGS